MQSQLRTELERIFAAENRPTYRDLKELKLLDCVVYVNDSAPHPSMLTVHLQDGGLATSSSGSYHRSTGRQG